MLSFIAQQLTVTPGFFGAIVGAIAGGGGAVMIISKLWDRFVGGQKGNACLFDAHEANKRLERTASLLEKMALVQALEQERDGARHTELKERLDRVENELSRQRPKP